MRSRNETGSPDTTLPDPIRRSRTLSARSCILREASTSADAEQIRGLEREP
jgi:hypothetical protein